MAKRSKKKNKRKKTRSKKRSRRKVRKIKSSKSKGGRSKKSIIVKDEEGNSVIKVSEAWSNQALINNSKFSGTSPEAAGIRFNSTSRPINLAINASMWKISLDPNCIRCS